MRPVHHTLAWLFVALVITIGALILYGAVTAVAVGGWA